MVQILEKAAVFMLAVTLILLVGIGLETLAIGISGVDKMYDFKNFSVVQWIAQVSYAIFLLSIGIILGVDWIEE